MMKPNNFLYYRNLRNLQGLKLEYLITCMAFQCSLEITSLELPNFD